MISCPKCGHQIADSSTLTKRQLEVYAYIVEFVADHHYAPSHEEIAEHFELGALSTVHEHLHQLEVKGFIAKKPLEARGIRCLVRLDEIGDPPPDRGTLVRRM